MNTRISYRSSGGKRFFRQGGYIALVTTLVLVGIAVLLMASTAARNVSSSRMNDRSARYITCECAAEAAVEKVLAHMIVDFDQYGEGQVLSNMNQNTYQIPMLPNATLESSYWTNFIWSDAQGHANRIYVARTSTATNAAFVSLQEQYAGLSGYSSTYRILANCSLASSPYNYNFTNAVQYDLQLAQIPIFQFAIFYNGLLEFSDCATMVVNGNVYCNSNIYVGCDNSSTLTFNGMVNCAGNITSPPNVGITSWTAGAVTYNGTPAPGYLTGQPTLALPVGTNSAVGSSVQQILYPPLAGESVTSAIGTERYFNKAFMTIWVSNQNSTPIYNITLKSSSSDSSPITFTNLTSKLNGSGYFPWLTVSSSFTDNRENKTMHVTQIDVAQLSNWMSTNVYVYSTKSTSNKFNATNYPLNIIWVGDWRYSNSTDMSAVRLINGTTLPSAGLTVATPNPLYVQGLYNCPNAVNQGSTNVTGTAPASFACDALTVLSPSWSDSVPKGNAASDDTINAAILAGNVPSTGTTSTTYSGGVHNLPRLLEDWSGAKLTLNTSLVCLYSSTWATGQFLQPSTYYSAPTRQFSFNQNYNYSSGMPPGTPNICRLIRASWCNPAPDTVSYYSQTLDFVPR